MAQAGVYAPGAVIDADVTVRVAGVPREHVSMSWSGDTTGGLPDQVVSAGTGMRSRTGSITWAQSEAVVADPPHPLRQTGGWPPREGDEVVIDATVDTGQGPYTWRRFTGRIGRTTGSLTDGTLASEITDTLGDSLQAVCSISPAILGNYTRSQQIAYRAMEQAGLGLLPPPDQWTVGHVGGQGGVDASVGTIAPGQTGTVYGTLYGVEVTTGLRLVPTTTNRAGRAVLVMGRASDAHNSILRTSLTTGTEVSLEHHYATGALLLHVSGVGHVWTGTSTDTSPLTVLAVQFMQSGTRVYTSPSTWVTVTEWTIPAGADVRWAEGTLLAGRSIRILPTANAGSGIVASTPALPAGWLGSALESEFLPASRSIENVPARQVVDAWSEATLASVWMDEHGKPWCIARDRLLTRPVSRTLRVDERVLAGSWTVGDDQVRSGVIVKGQQSARQTSTPQGGHRVTVHQDTDTRGTEASMTEPEERFIEAPAEVEWGPMQLELTRAGGQGSELNGSWYGGVVVQPGDGGFWFQQTGTTVSVVAERVGQRTIKLSEMVGNLPAGGTFYPRFATTGTSTHPAIRGMALPIIRAEWITTWADYVVTGATTGPAWAPPLEHDAGWFLTPGNAQRVADALAVEVTQAMPTLSGVSVLWDPTRQIGDVETWIATDSAGNESWRANVLVSGYGESWDGNVPTQSVDVRVISWTDPTEGKTYGDLAAAYSRYANMSGTYQQVHDALPNPR